MPMTAPFRERTEDGSPTGRIIYSGVHAADAAALTHCAANGVDLTRADLRNRDLRNANVSGLIAPKCDLRGANCRGWVADRRVAGRICELSASLLSGATPAEDALLAGTLTLANLACTRPGRFRVETGANTRLRGCDWSACPDVIELPLSRTEVTRSGRCIALRNGAGWKVHASERGVLTEAQARTTLAAVPEYVAAVAYLDSPECTQRKAEIEARPAGAEALDGGDRVR